MEMSIRSWVLSKLTNKELSFSEKVRQRPAAPRAVRPITHRLSCQFGNPEMITIQNRFSHTTDITTMLTEAADSHHHGLGLNIIQLWLKPGRGTRASWQSWHGRPGKLQLSKAAAVVSAQFLQASSNNNDTLEQSWARLSSRKWARGSEHCFYKSTGISTTG